MSLLDIDKTKAELSELDYMLYDKFVKYMEEHVPRPLWDHSREPGMPPRHTINVSYIKVSKPTRIHQIDNDPEICNGDLINESLVGEFIPTQIGLVVNKIHSCIYITPTDDGQVNLEWSKFTLATFPILTTSDVPKGVLNVLEPIKDRLEIIHGIL